MTAALSISDGTEIVLVPGVETLWHLPGSEGGQLDRSTLCGLAGMVYVAGPITTAPRRCCQVCAARAPKGLLAPARKPGKRRGRPKGKYQRITEPQLRALHVAHWDQRVPINELGRRHWQKLGFGSANACANTISKRFRDADLPRHDRIAMTVQASTSSGLSPRDYQARRAARKAAGVRTNGQPRHPSCSRCTRPAQFGSGFCYSHDPESETERLSHLAEMRARSPLHNRVDLIAAGPLVAALVAYQTAGGAWSDLARESGVPQDWISHIAKGKQARVAAARARAIHEVLGREAVAA